MDANASGASAHLTSALGASNVRRFFGENDAIFGEDSSAAKLAFYGAVFSSIPDASLLGGGDNGLADSAKAVLCAASKALAAIVNILHIGHQI